MESIVQVVECVGITKEMRKSVLDTIDFAIQHDLRYEVEITNDYIDGTRVEIDVDYEYFIQVKQDNTVNLTSSDNMNINDTCIDNALHYILHDYLI